LDITVRRDKPLHYGEVKRHVTLIAVVFLYEREQLLSPYIVRHRLIQSWVPVVLLLRDVRG
jgi:hypothetical protein